ncbi:MAG: hypothetical protein ACLTYN_12250 [Dysosmobacter welbionis]
MEGNSCADRRLPGKDCTLGEWLTFWLEEVVARDRAESTLYAYRNMARCHVLPALGRILWRSRRPCVSRAISMRR